MSNSTTMETAATSVPALAVARAWDRGTQVAAVIDGQPVTYGELADRAARVTGGLQALGVEPGDRVAVMLSTRPEFLYAWFGILGAGAIEVPIHDAARGPGIAYILQTTGARLLIVDDEHVEHVAEQVAAVPSLRHVVVVGDVPVLARPASSFAALLAHERAAFVEVAPSAPASILFTGGTTGPPKGVVVSHNHNLNMARGVVDMLGYDEQDTLYSVFPLFHANAKYVSVLASMVAGARVVVDRRFSASRFWETCRREGVTAFNGMGEMLRILLKRDPAPEDADHGVRVVFGAAAPVDLIEAFEQRFGVAVLDVYGLTETGPVTAITWDHRRPGSCGIPTPWYEVRIVDEHDHEVAPGEVGEIVVRPRRPHVMMEGYWGNEAATLKTLRNLWFHTGDLASRDEDGFFWFRERGTDSIRRRGENVSAWEVERVLADHPELLEAAVFGVPAEIGGQEVMVAAVRRPGVVMTPEALLDYCTGKMPHFAVPRYVRFMDKLPRSHAQRVLKHELKADGAGAPGVWDREAAGYVVKR
jgi:crotonobetaine/carnitine-CoA ligase